MSQYYEYFAAGLKSDRVVWAEPFEECCGMGTITTASIPCYSTGSVEVESTLIGVASSSVPLGLLGSTNISDLLARSTFCSPFNLDEAHLENLRGSERCNGLSEGDTIVVAAVLGAVGLAVIACLIACLLKKKCAQEADHEEAAAYYGNPPAASAPPIDNL